MLPAQHRTLNFSFSLKVKIYLKGKEKVAYWSFWVVKSLGMPINTYLCSIYYIYDTKNAFSAGQIPP
jgi:hypothetical protein